MQEQIKQFEKRFHALKNASRECLERHKVPVKMIANTLTSLPADDMPDHKLFLESHMSEIYQSPDHFELFGTMDFHWNYQNYHLLDYLIQEFDLEGIKSEMNIYKKDLWQFRKKTPLKLFCESQKKRYIKPPQEFHEMVVKFDWPDKVTLEVVEEFRQEYASHYRLRECAMMLNKVLPGSFIITWLIPVSIVEKLKVKVPVPILRKHFVTNLEISGELVYSKTMKKVKDSMQKHSKGARAGKISAEKQYYQPRNVAAVRAGAGVGALIGAGIGSVVPVAGTIAGAVAGGIIGGACGMVFTGAAGGGGGTFGDIKRANRKIEDHRYSLQLHMHVTEDV